jgi:hypothetical protein
MKTSKLIKTFLLFCVLTLDAQTPVYTIYKPVSGSSPENDIQAIKLDKTTNTIWAAIWDQPRPLKKFDGVNWTSYTYSINNCVQGYGVDLAIDKFQNIWYAGYGNGLSKFNGTTFTNYTTANSGLANNFVSCIETNNSGDLLLYAQNFHKTQSFDGTTWTDLDSFSYGTDMCHDSVTNITWMACYYGLQKIQGSTVTTYTASSNTALYGTYSSVTVDNAGNVWLAGHDNNNVGGLFKFNGSTFTSYTSANSGLLNNNPDLVRADGNGDIWISGYYYQGLTRFDGINWVSYNISPPNFPSTNIRDIAFQNSSIRWIATDNGLVKMELATNIKKTNLEDKVVLVYPNPFEDQLTVNMLIPIDSKVTVIAYDILGRGIKLHEGKENKGKLSLLLNFDNSVAAPGTYLLKISVNDKIYQQKIIKSN